MVLKTAMPGILHKSDVGGVKLNLADAAGLRAAYDDMAARLGRTHLLAPMAAKGFELSFGAKLDPQFGPVVMVGAGGILIEFMADRACALAPFDENEAQRLIDGLALRPLLDGKRGAPPSDIACAGLCARAFFRHGRRSRRSGSGDRHQPDAGGSEGLCGTGCADRTGEGERLEGGLINLFHPPGCRMPPPEEHSVKLEPEMT